MAKSFYHSKAWRRLRALKLKVDPLCEDCETIGRLVDARHVDHRIAISSGGDPLPPLDQLASLCASCHSHKTARGPEAGGAKTSKPRKGCSPDGVPLDRRHPWRAENLSELPPPHRCSLRFDS